MATCPLTVRVAGEAGHHDVFCHRDVFYSGGMIQICLRAVRVEDLPKLRVGSVEDDPFGFFGFRATNVRERRFASDGMISDADGTLVVEDENDAVAGSVSWHAVQHGPASTARALNIGISLLPEHRGRGLGTAAQAALADYLFAYTLTERLEASTDLDNLAEQRALEKAGFQREGVARHAQFRAGQWHDIVIYSRLRGDGLA